MVLDNVKDGRVKKIKEMERDEKWREIVRASLTTNTKTMMFNTKNGVFIPTNL